MITCRRHYLDEFLIHESSRMKGHVLDIGGKKSNKRGTFRPPSNNIVSWKYANIDTSTKPDYCCSAENIPVASESVDGFFLCEVLEHLKHPEAALTEAFRILKTGGTGWITMPFLYQVHANPEDYQRWTRVKLRMELEKSGFRDIHIKPMGSVAGVIYDLCHASLCRSPNHGNTMNRLFLRLLRILGRPALTLDRKFMRYSTHITTGYAATVRK